MPAIFSTAELDELHSRLLAEHARLTAELAAAMSQEGARDSESSDASTDAAGDEADVSVTQDAWDTSYQEALDLRDQLREVEHALGKFAPGTYGRCEECGEPIPLARLRLLPAARYDARHQAEVEARLDASPHSHTDG